MIYIGIAAAAVLLLGAAGWVLSAVVAKPHFNTTQDIRTREIKRGTYGDFDDLPKERYTIRRDDGYELGATFVPAAEPTDRYVIITHGYTANRMDSVKYVRLFRKLGCNCVIYDNRGHGDNVRTYVTMGKREHRDLLAVIEDTRRRFGADIRIGLHGESMGSATSVLALGEKPPVDFLVSDCGYAELPRLLYDLLGKTYHLPGWLIWPASVISRVRFGFGYREIMPRKALEGNEVPILFVHGQADDFILPEHVQLFYEHATCRRELLLVPGAGHAASIITDPAGYEAAVTRFVRENWP